jgi:hypothetical protein
MVGIQIEASASVVHFRKTDCIHSYCNMTYVHVSNTYLNLNGIPGVHQAVSVTSVGSSFFIVLSRLLNEKLR